MNFSGRPVVIVGTPRSGTSMTAGLFARHGCWTGECRKPNRHNPKGFFENLELKKILLKRAGAIVHEGRVAEYHPGFAKDINNLLVSQGYEGGPWLMKHSALYWKLWQDFYPIWVVCWRDPVSIVQSGMKSGYFAGGKTEKALMERIALHHEEMRNIEGHHVDTQKVAFGDFSSIRPAIEEIGEFNEELAAKFVDRSHWHHVAANDNG